MQIRLHKYIDLKIVYTSENLVYKIRKKLNYVYNTTRERSKKKEIQKIKCIISHAYKKTGINK